MPTSSLSYLDLPDHNNPWDEQVSSILNHVNLLVVVNKIKKLSYIKYFIRLLLIYNHYY